MRDLIYSVHSVDLVNKNKNAAAGRGGGMCLRAVFGYVVLLITYRHMVLSLALVKCMKNSADEEEQIQYLH